MTSNRQRKALVTGATGFIGRHLARELLAAGWELHLISRPDTDLGTLADLENRLTVHIHDGTTEQLLRFMDKVKPDVVFHLASLFIAQHQTADIEPLIRTNLLFATQLAEVMVQSGCFRMVNTGTSWEHFENSSYSPVNLYAATKQAYEVLLEYYLATTSLKVISLKLFDTYGPNDPRPKLFTLLQRVAVAGEPLAMSPGEQLLDLVYIDDIVSAFLLAADRLLDNRVPGHERYAVSSGKPLRLKDLVEIYAKVTGRSLPIEWGGRPYRPREVMVPWNAGVVLPGWKPKVGLEEGIRLLVADIESDGKKVSKN